MLTNNKWNEVYDTLVKLDAEELLQIFTNAHGNQIIDEYVLSELIDMGLIDEDEEDNDDDINDEYEEEN